MGDDEPGDGALFHPLLLHARFGPGSDAAAQQIADRGADELHVLQVHAGLRFVEQEHIRLLGHELEQFRTFDLAAGKAGIDVAFEKGVHMDGAGQPLHIHVLVPGTHGDELAGFQAMDGGRTLERHADAEPGPLVDGSMGDVMAAKKDPALGNFVVAKAHEGHKQGGLARTVGPKQDEGLVFGNVEVDAGQHLSFADGDVQILDAQHVRLAFSRPGGVFLRPRSTEKRQGSLPIRSGGGGAAEGARAQAWS